MNDSPEPDTRLAGDEWNAHAVPVPPGTRPRATSPEPRDGRLARLVDETASVATEYGLLAIVAATIVAVVLEWATSGGISGLLDRVLARVSTLVSL